MIEYEIYVNSIHGSDVVTFDTLDSAIKCAEEWSMNVIDCDVVIEKVERNQIKSFRHGSELGL